MTDITSLSTASRARGRRSRVNKTGRATSRAFSSTGPCFSRTHEKADLAQAHIEDGRLVCPRHLASFSLTDGAASRGWRSIASSSIRSASATARSPSTSLRYGAIRRAACARCGISPVR